MDFKQLTGIEKQLDSLTRNRQLRSEEDYQQGLRALFQARNSSFQDKAALREACEKLLSALQKHRSNPAPYLGLAYLLMVMGDRPRARRYLRSALQLEPGNELAQDLQRSLLEVEQVQLTADDELKLASQALQQEAKDLDALFEQTEQQLRGTLTALMREPHQTQPTLDPSCQQMMRSKADELQVIKSRFEARLHRLEAEFDTTRLSSLMRPIDVLIRRYQQGLSISETFERLNTEMTAQNQQARRLMVAVHIRREHVSEEYDQLLDTCDALADQLDALDEQQIDISEIKKPYKDLLVQIGLLQELRDDLL